MTSSKVFNYLPISTQTMLQALTKLKLLDGKKCLGTKIYSPRRGRSFLGYLQRDQINLKAGRNQDQIERFPHRIL
jgi:hypothetical protein